MKNSNENGRAPIIALAGIAALLTISILTAQTVRRDLVLDGNGTVVAPSGFWATNAASITNAVGTNYATRAQGILAASALQAGASWTNISGLGTAATNSSSVFAPASGSTNYATTNDSRFPTSAQKAAMVGSSGSPGATNVFVTAIDPVNTNSRPPTGSASGDLFGSYPSPTLATNGVTAGTYGSQTNVPVFVIDAKGRVSSASASATITPASIGAATAAQGALAASALQTNTSWTNISGLGTAATNAASAFVPSARTINSVDLSANRTLNDIGAASVRLIKTADFTADINGRYTVSGTATVTDPAGTTAGQIYSVVIGSGTATIGGVAYAPSRVEVIREYSGSAWSTLAPTLADNLTLNGTANTAPNQTAASGSSLMTRDLGDARFQVLAMTALPTPLATSGAGGNNSYLLERGEFTSGVTYGTYTKYSFFKGIYCVNTLMRSLTITPTLPTLSIINIAFRDAYSMNGRLVINQGSGTEQLREGTIASSLKSHCSGATTQGFLYTFSDAITAAAGDVIVLNSTGHTFTVDVAVTASTTVRVRDITGGGVPTTSDTSLTVNGGAPVTTSYVKNSATNAAAYPQGLLYFANNTLKINISTFISAGSFDVLVTGL